MSIRVTTHVWEHSQARGTALLLLLALADQSNDQGISWPSVGFLAAKARLSEREVHYLIKKIAETGELQVLRGGGRKRPNVYQLTVQGLQGSEPVNEGEVQDLHPIQTQDSDIGASPAPITDISAERVQNPEERVQPVVEKGATGGRKNPVKGAKSDEKGAMGCTRTVLTVLNGTVIEPYEPSRARARGATPIVAQRRCTTCYGALPSVTQGDLCPWCVRDERKRANWAARAAQEGDASA